MRHGDKINNLGRTTAHRKALLSNLACQLIEHKRIFTTLAKAKSLRTYIEPMITRSKNDNTHNRRLVFSHLQNKGAVTELFSVISDKVADRPGGYTRIIKTQPRMGDAADMAMIELVDFNTLYVKDAKDGAKKTRRSRRGSGSNVAKAQTTDKQKTTAPAPANDDLTRIEGIGPKIAEALNQAGIRSYADLGANTPDAVKQILDAAEGDFNMADPATWPQQAQLAAEGKWEDLQSLQDSLKGGKASE